jgi:arylformamidase
MSKIYDISPLIHSQTAVFPGDTVFERQVMMETSKGDHLGLSWIKSTLHIGAHADAGNHYHRSGRGIDSVDLNRYFGSCQVIKVQLSPGERVGLHHLKEKKISAPRILFRTDSFPDPNHWNSDFNSLSPEVIHHLAIQSVVLVGIDTPSVDPETSKVLESHQALWDTQMSVLEGIDLSQVPEGLYQLIALPLKIKDADASPVRAILIEN